MTLICLELHGVSMCFLSVIVKQENKRSNTVLCVIFLGVPCKCSCIFLHQNGIWPINLVCYPHSNSDGLVAQKLNDNFNLLYDFFWFLGLFFFTDLVVSYVFASVTQSSHKSDVLSQLNQIYSYSCASKQAWSN